MERARGRIPLRPFVSALVVLAASATRVSAAGSMAFQCSDPCVAAARASARECASSATGAFTDALDGCLARDHQCVDACRFGRVSCRDATGIGTEIAACRLEEAAAKDDCRSRFPLGSDRRVACIDRAQADGSRCRRRARRSRRVERLACTKAFHACASACAPGQPPDGVAACRSQGRAAAQAQLALCRRTLQVEVTACFDKDLTCGLDCIEARQACAAPTNATLDAALSACTAAERSAAVACVQMNPGGGTALDDCLEAAQANAYACRDAAFTAAGPGLTACLPPYVACVRACPPA